MIDILDFIGNTFSPLFKYLEGLWDNKILFFVVIGLIVLLWVAVMYAAYRVLVGL